MRAQFLLCGLLLATLPTVCSGQNATMPPDYRGPEVQVFGVFVTPVPNAAFSAKVDTVSRQKLDDGTTSERSRTTHIARDSSGRIYNERRAMVALGVQGEQPLISAHIYDPATRMSVFFSPYTHLAQEVVLAQPLSDPVAARAARQTDPAVKEEDLGMQTIGTLVMHGTRKSRTITGLLSSTGAPLVVTDEYWFSPDLSMYMVIKHNDPRTGEQIVGISEVDRKEPPASMFTVPAGYKVVDETPVDDGPAHP